MEPAAPAGHVRARVPPVEIGPLVDGGVAPALIDELRRIAGADWVFTSAHQLRTYESDGLLQYHATPAAAVLPGSADEVQAVVRACAAAGVPWVARGARSGEGSSTRRATTCWAPSSARRARSAWPPRCGCG